MSRIKDVIMAKVALGNVRSTNDGVRTQAIRFIENVVLMYSDIGPSQTEGKKRAGLSLQSVPPGHSILHRKALREEGGRILDDLIQLLSTELSASNYQVLIYVLGAVAKERVPRADTLMPHILNFCLALPAHLKPQPRKSTDKAGKTPTLPAAVDLGVGQDDDEGAEEAVDVAGQTQHKNRAKELLSQVGHHALVDMVLDKMQGFPSGPAPEGSAAVDPRQKEISPMITLLKAGSELEAFEGAAQSIEELLEQQQDEATAAAAPRKDPRKRKQMEDAEALVASGTEIGPAPKLARVTSADNAVDTKAAVVIQASSSTTLARAKPAAQLPAAKRKRPHVATVEVDLVAMRSAAWKRLMSRQCQVGMEMAGASHIRLAQLARLGVQQVRLVLFARSSAN